MSFVGFENQKLVRFNSSSPNVTETMNPDQCWKDCEIPLRFLNRVCPAVETWVRDRHDTGHLVWETGSKGYLGKYDYITKTLTLTSDFFRQNDGMKAEILAHEFRHSRQSMSKVIRCVFANVLLRDRERWEWIVEDEAYHFEAQVHIAIFE